ncbi:hypothetical protein GCM10020221_05810 [Streptomyces thioluteus]|uniref:Peptidase S33 tripeptidyl aminopeptidase-like C-terminal domain-containing protein n=1 Tax=Streptomyces thioluteus TaxID=66431 RepID=A0ABN3WED3_STRTU
MYATLFPGHVRRMVFDSVVNPDPHRVWYHNNLDQSAAFERRWTDWRRWAARHDAVYHLGRTERQVLASYHKAMEQLRRRAAGGRVGPGQLQGALVRAGYTDSAWASGARALSAFLRGDDGPLVALAGPSASGAPAAENSNAVYTAVECNDAPWPRSWHQWDRDNTRLARKAPFETWANAFMNLPCAYWTTPRQRPLDVRTARKALPPVLLLAAERDAATPYAGALELQRRLSGSVLVTERNAGTHGIGGGPNACVKRSPGQYLLTGALPPAARRARAAPSRGRADDPNAGRADSARPAFEDERGAAALPRAEREETVKGRGGERKPHRPPGRLRQPRHQLRDRLAPPRVERHLLAHVHPRLGRPEVTHQVDDPVQVVRLEGQDPLVVAQRERGDRVGPDVRVAAGHLAVVGEHAAAVLVGQQVPVVGAHERYTLT